MHLAAAPCYSSEVRMSTHREKILTAMRGGPLVVRPRRGRPVDEISTSFSYERRTWKRWLMRFFVAMALDPHNTRLVIFRAKRKK